MTDKKTTFSRNISHLRSLNRKSQQEVADTLGFKHKSKYGAYEDGRAEPPLQILNLISEYYEVPMDMLVKEDLTALDWQNYWSLKDNWLKYMPLHEVMRRNRIIIAPEEHHARAGISAGQYEDQYMEVETITLPKEPGGEARAFPIKGDSMPPIYDGDYVVGKNVQLDSVQDGKTYIVRFQEDEGSPLEVLYKVVYNKTKEDGTLHLHSTNPGYKPRKVEVSKVIDIYEYFCHISYVEPSEGQLTIDDLGTMIKGLTKK